MEKVYSNLRRQAGNKSLETIPFRGEKSTRGCLTDGAHLSSKDSRLHRHLSEVLSRIPAGTPWALIPHQFSVVVVKVIGGGGTKGRKGRAVETEDECSGEK